jgi:hypothetical protein
MYLFCAESVFNNNGQEQKEQKVLTSNITLLTDSNSYYLLQY